MKEYYRKLIENCNSETHLKYYKSMLAYYEGGNKVRHGNQKPDGNKLRISIKEQNEVFNSLSEAANYFKCSIANISRVLSERDGRFKKHNCTLELI